jgi:hypothetical protein
MMVMFVLKILATLNTDVSMNIIIVMMMMFVLKIGVIVNKDANTDLLNMMMVMNVPLILATNIPDLSIPP